MILHGSVLSKVLGTATGITVFTPDELCEKTNYKVVYLLHGLHGNNRTWVNNTMLTQFGGKYDAIFVMPEVGRSFYCDMKHGYNYKMYVGEELPEIVQNVFKISSKREDTAVMGCSMGGYGALKLALSKPGQYGFCGAISSACLFLNENLKGLRREGAAWAAQSPSNAALLRDMYAIFGDDLTDSDENDPVILAEECAKLKKKPYIYAACGKSDSLLDENRRYNHKVQELSLDYKFEEWEGGHDWMFFSDALKRALDVWQEVK
ncbi:MAG: alpha/beta hydrolase family protein [Termitinemataceae bacterium]|nr:MAG: alpha/beta hydrolase family protein [Termitinemataceae bacterium]